VTTTLYSQRRGDVVAFDAFVRASGHYDGATKSLVAYGLGGGIIGIAAIAAALASPAAADLFYDACCVAACLYACGAAVVVLWCGYALARVSRARATFNQSLHDRWGA